MSDTKTEDQPLTVVLTNRHPVTIQPDKWPCIAWSKDWDNQHECQANRVWKLFVRRHADGRTLVYGTYQTNFQNERNRAGGELLKPGHDVPAAIIRVSESLGVDPFDPVLAERCIATLPPENLD